MRRFNVCDFSEGCGAENQAEYLCQENFGYNFLHIDWLLVLNFLPKGTKFNQDHFIDMVLPNLYSEKRQIAMRKDLRIFSVHMDNSMSHNGAKIIKKLEKRHVARAPHPPYSPNLSPCDFWLFGILKQKMKERAFQSEEQNLVAITESWKELTFEDIQRVFQNCMERLTWVIANSGEY
jgi:transposase